MSSEFVNQKILVVVDGDPIVYRCGFAAEKHCIELVYGEADEGVEHIIFEPKDGVTANAQYKSFVADKAENGDDYYEASKDVIVLPEPVEHCLSTVKAVLKDIRYSVAEHFKVDVDDVVLRVVLTGPGNFRNEVATIKPYKGNRKETHKPYHYQAVRNYLTDWWDAEVISGREADDECSIVQRSHDGTVIIATVDKDLDMVPGWHYDYWRKTFYHTTESEGLALFYKQVLCGDSTDNIGGCFKIGATRAARIVDDYLLDNPDDWRGLWDVVVEKYRESIEKYGEKCPYYGQDPAAVALENARLVWMQEYEGQLWTPPGEKDEVIEKEVSYD